MVFFCTVCLGAFTSEDDIYAPDDCTHCFHFICLENCLKERDHCPHCQTEATGMRQIFLSSRPQEPTDQTEEIDAIKARHALEIKEVNDDLQRISRAHMMEVIETNVQLETSYRNLADTEAAMNQEIKFLQERLQQSRDVNTSLAKENAELKLKLQASVQKPANKSNKNQ